MIMFRVSKTFICLVLAVCFDFDVTDGANYFLGKYEGVTTAFPIGKCITDSDGSYLYECINDGTEVLEYYWDFWGQDCTDFSNETLTNTTLYNENNAEFECNEENYFVDLEIIVDFSDTCNAAIATTALAIDVCYNQISSRNNTFVKL